MKFAAWTKDRKDLKNASSGGIFYELAKKFVSDGGVVCGVIMEGMIPEFIMTSNLKDIKKMRGSKYLWANPVPIFECMKDSKVPILVVGLPCQIIGLKRYMKIKGFLDGHITYVSLRCHGVINKKIFYDYIRWVENVAKIIITGVKFRDKTTGWKGAGIKFIFKRSSK